MNDSAYETPTNESYFIIFPYLINVFHVSYLSVLSTKSDANIPYTPPI